MKLNTRSKKAFTLLEIMMVVLITSITLAIAYMSWEEGDIKQRTTAEKLKMLSDLRLAGKEMMREARNANRFYIFESFPAQLDNEGNVTQGTLVEPGSTGNYLVLDSVILGDVIERTGYYLEGVTPTSGGNIRKFRQTYNGSGVPALPVVGIDHRTVIDNARGNNEDDQIFYNAGGTSILVEGRISVDIRKYYGSQIPVDMTRTFNFQLQPLLY